MNCFSLEKCPFCQEKLIASHTTEDDLYEFINCPNCGKVTFRVSPENITEKIKNEIASYLSYKKLELSQSKYTGIIIEDVEYKNNIKKDIIGMNLVVSIDEILLFYPRTFSEKIDMILLDLAKKSEYIGYTVEMTRSTQMSAWFIKRFDEFGNALKEDDILPQINSIGNYLIENNYIQNIISAANGKITITPKGWERIDGLQKSVTSNKNVFVSMAFNDNTKSTREAIRKGIVDSGFSPEFIDEIIHNKQIVPEMFRLIRESRFLILDITDPNYGAYYEAGYALGLGKEVIICCSEEMFNKEYSTEEEKKYAKYLKPHFDIAQKQILVWKDEKDLSKELTEWIKFIFN